MADDPFSLVLFSGTDDKLTAGAVLAVGAAVMGRPVNILLQYWAVDAFRKDRIGAYHGVAPEAGVEGDALVRTGQTADSHWSAVLRQAKELGDVRIHACALTTGLFGIAEDDLDPLVDGIEGVASFMSDAANGSITFI